VVYPKGMSLYGRALAWLTGAYDRRARALFLSTLTPETLWAKFKAQVVLAFTSGFDLVTRHIGWGNLAYVALLGLVSVALQSPLPILIGASFVHYLLYVFVFEFRDWISFGQFKRDAMFFKGVSYTMIAAIYLSVPVINPLSLGMMAVGYGLATAATAALGVDRTWFGVELGQLEPERITAFPYNVVPHPMIVGAGIGLVGIALHEPFWTTYPWLVPMHLLGYSIHLVQEATDPLAPGKVDTAAPTEAK
ncbi:MAG: methyltransferase, partial [Myxococcota bacterium]